MDIIPLDRDDDVMLKELFGLACRSEAVSRVQPIQRTEDEFLKMVRFDFPGEREEGAVAMVDGSPAAWARIFFPERDNLDKCWSHLEVVTTPYQGYWEQRGWVKAAVVRTMSRVDGYGEVGGGTFVAGVAFAGDRGISRVEVSLDDGATWADAELERPLSGLTWRRWRLPFDPGTDPVVVVRATDGEGVVQPAEPMDPHPSGATGLDRVTL